ncbi:hypothetical protein EWM62_05345 [Mucilaginibacter terrigena]|uniref:Uncharacterized protein n=1 Tax=Mucilaginibacter terrigena TaxID=2492395 RepID=A0A4Q5LPM7_9SPHI|nr:hypothetical protein [Mucilaginibacter terrigena]RYU91366.1 hypothetical protein EWM62_05345 [Mucilaginibacter terrigena]
MKITTGTLELMESGILFTQGNNTLTFDLGFELKLTLKFIDDSNAKESTHDFKKIDNNSGLWTFKNFNNLYGSGFSEPLKLGTFNGSDIYLSIWVTRLFNEQVNKKVEYTFYKEQ